MASFVLPVRTAPLMRVYLFKVSKQKYYLFMDIHHLLIDPISQSIIEDDLAAFYQGKELPPLLLEYKDYAVWQNDRLNNGELESQKDFWVSHLQDIPVLNLPTVYDRPSVVDFKGEHIIKDFPENLYEKVKKFASEKKRFTTTFNVMLAAYYVLLYKYTSQERIIVGTPTVGRTHQVHQKLVGFFLGSLPLINEPKYNIIFERFLEKVTSHSIEAFDNQEYPLENMIRDLDFFRESNSNPLFNTVFSLVYYNHYKKRYNDLEYTPFSYNDRTSKFDLLLEVFENNKAVKLVLEYSTSLFSPDFAEQFMCHYLNILESVITDPEQLLGKIDILNKKEKDFIIKSVNNTDYTFPVQTRLLHKLFELEAERVPDAIAIRFHDTSITYAELNTSANRLAYYLITNYGIEKGACIGILFHRSIEMIIAVLAVLKSGACYLGLDPIYPEERINHMIQEGNASLILTNSTDMPDTYKDQNTFVFDYESRLIDFIIKNEIENIYLPFYYLNHIFNSEAKKWQKIKHEIHNIITGGEQLIIIPAFKEFIKKQKSLRIFNMYGSTESKMALHYIVNHTNVDKYIIPPIGLPIFNIKVFILDANKNITPFYIFGEIYIKIASVFQGYIKRSDLNYMKCIKININGEEVELLKTGDIGRYLPDGNVEYKGRKDNMYKVRGYRIDMGEIEKTLIDIPAVDTCAVVPQLDDNNKVKELIAYVTGKKRLTSKAIYEILNDTLPSYMLPRIAIIEEMPLLISGNIFIYPCIFLNYDTVF